MAHLITENDFSEKLSEKLGKQYKRALTIFQNYGKKLSYDVTNVLLHAVDQNKVDEVFQKLEEHYEKHLKFQHPEIRGTVESRPLGVNETQTMFMQICEDILCLKSA